MSFQKALSMLLALVLLCVCFGACGDETGSKPTYPDEGSTAAVQNSTQPTETQPTVPDPTPVDVKTNSGAVIVGEIGVDDQGWYIRPEQPLNITFEFFSGQSVCVCGANMDRDV